MCECTCMSYACASCGDWTQARHIACGRECVRNTCAGRRCALFSCSALREEVCFEVRWARDKSITCKSITLLARDHVRWTAVDRPRMHRDERRLRVHVMTLQTSDLQLLLSRKRFPEYGQVVAVRPMADGCDGCRSSTTSLSCTFSVSWSLLLSRSLVGWSTYHELILNYIPQHPHASQGDVGQHFGIGQSSVSTIIKNKDSIRYDYPYSRYKICTY